MAYTAEKSAWEWRRICDVTVRKRQRAKEHTENNSYSSGLPSNANIEFVVCRNICKFKTSVLPIRYGLKPFIAQLITCHLKRSTKKLFNILNVTDNFEQIQRKYRRKLLTSQIFASVTTDTSVTGIVQDFSVALSMSLRCKSMPNTTIPGPPLLEFLYKEIFQTFCYFSTTEFSFWKCICCNFICCALWKLYLFVSYICSQSYRIWFLEFPASKQNK